MLKSGNFDGSPGDRSRCIDRDGCRTAILIVTGLLGWSSRRVITGTGLVALVIERFVLLPGGDAGAHQACQSINSGSGFERFIHQTHFFQVRLEELIRLGVLVGISGGSEDSAKVDQNVLMIIGWRLLEVD